MNFLVFLDGPITTSVQQTWSLLMWLILAFYCPAIVMASVSDNCPVSLGKSCRAESPNDLQSTWSPRSKDLLFKPQRTGIVYYCSISLIILIGDYTCVYVSHISCRIFSLVTNLRFSLQMFCSSSLNANLK